MKISATAYQTGFGTDRYKAVCGLTREEKTAIKAGETIFFRSSARSGGNHGTYWRVVSPRLRGRVWYFNPRVPSPVDVAALESAQ